MRLLSGATAAIMLTFAIIGSIAAPSINAKEVGQSLNATFAPALIRVDGVFLTANGEPRTGNVTLVASVYDGEADVDALWVERQTVTLDAQGRFAILLGSTLADGLPKELFVSASAKNGWWVGIAIDGESEQSRTRLLSVPYALRSLDADTLGGRSGSDFVLQSELTNALSALQQQSTTQQEGTNGGLSATAETTTTSSSIEISDDAVANPVALAGYVRVGRGAALVTRNQFNTANHVLIGSNLSVTDDTAVGDHDFATTLRGPWITVPGSPSGPGGRPYFVFGNLDSSHAALTTNGVGLQVERADRSGLLAPFSAGSVSASSVSVSGNITASLFTGQATGLTNIPAAGLTGTIPAAVLGTNVATLSSQQTFSGANTFSNPLNIFTGKGTGLTNIPASSLTGTMSAQAVSFAAQTDSDGGGIGMSITDNPLTNPVGLHGYLRVGRGRALVTRNSTNTGDHILIGSGLSATDDTAIGDANFATTLRGAWVTIPGSPSSPGGRPYLIFGNLDSNHAVITTNGAGLQVERADRSGILAPLTTSTLTANSVSASSVIASTFTGKGTGLTNIPASSISGTADAMSFSFAAKPDPDFGGGLGFAITENQTTNPVGLHGYIRVGRGQAIVTRNEQNTGDHILLGSHLTNADDTAIGDGDYVTTLRGAWVIVPGSPIAPSGRPYFILGNLDSDHPVLTTNGPGLQIELADRSGVLAPFSAGAISGTSVTASGSVIATTFSGSGAGLTNLPASMLTGSIPSSALGDVATLSNTQTFSGANSFTNASNTFAGDGSQLSGLTQLYSSSNAPACDSGRTGNIYFNRTAGAMQYCDGTQWKDVTPKRDSVYATASLSGSSCWGGDASTFSVPGLSASYTSNSRPLLISAYLASTSLNSSGTDTVVYRIVDNLGAVLGATSVTYSNGESKPVSVNFPLGAYTAGQQVTFSLQCASATSTATITAADARLLIAEQ